MLAWIIAGVGLGLTGVVVFPLSVPKPFFSHSISYENLELYSDQPIPEEQAEMFLAEVEDKLENSVFELEDPALQIYVANKKWHRKWIWLTVPKDAGGFAIYPLTRSHAFLSGADFGTGGLIGPSGYRPHPPRTLEYYGTHELTHVVTGQEAGWFRWLVAPKWVKEGLADYVAMPSESAGELYAKIGEEKADLEMMKTYGVYAPYRLLVTYFLEEEGWSLEQLLQTRMSLKKAQELVYSNLNSG